MKKVYDDKSLHYGKILNFEEPAQMTKDPIYADQNFKDIVNSGDTSNQQDQGNGNAGDFIVDPPMDNKAPEIPVESQFDNGKKDTSSKIKSKTELPAVTPKPTEQQKDAKAVMPAPIKPADDKNKKNTKPEKPKPVKNNDY